MQAEPNISRSRFIITPERARVDETVRIRLLHLLPGQLITIRMVIHDELGRARGSWATFRADGQGVVDVSEQHPLMGSYTEHDAMGLFWSLQPLASEPSYVVSPFQCSSLAPLTYELSAETAKQQIATARHECFFWIEQQVVRQKLDQDMVALPRF
jgi:Acyl-CoA thioester hydrolase/BAAT N-terminal region.